MTDAERAALIEYPCRQDDPARQHIGGIAAGIRIDEPSGERTDDVGVGDQRRDAPIREQRGEDCRCGEDGGFEDGLVHGARSLVKALAESVAGLAGFWQGRWSSRATGGSSPVPPSAAPSPPAQS